MRASKTRISWASVLLPLVAIASVGCQGMSVALRAAKPPMTQRAAAPDSRMGGSGDAGVAGAAVDPSGPDVESLNAGSQSPSDGQAADVQSANQVGPKPRGFLGLPPLSELLDDSPEEEDDDEDDKDGKKAKKSRKRTEPDINSPGPDTSNFPNSPLTLPQGRAYIETSPVFISGASQGSAKTYNAEFLLRYGLTDRVELRLFSNGPTFEKGFFAASGFAPIAYDIKTNLWKENAEYHIPAVGIEVFILTESGSKKLNQGTQPSIDLLFKHSLPFGIELEWNVGLVGDPSPNNKFASIEPAAAWAFERDLFEGFTVFFQGYFNGPTLPRFADGVELGVGFEWKFSKRFAFWSSYNLGVSRDAPNDIFYLGGAMAF